MPGDVGVAGADTLGLPPGVSITVRAFGDVVNASARITAMTRFPGAIRSTSTM